ncbi:MAG: STAS domain-containing protein [Ignavibacteriaceae bacterium]
MSIHAEINQDNSIIIIDENKLVGTEAETFHNLVQESINKGSNRISVDLSKVEFMSSWGIGLLVHAYTTCSKKNIKFNLQGVNSQIMNLLSQIKLTELFEII